MADKPDKLFNFEKMKMNDGWYCVRDNIVINRSDFECPAPLGSRICLSSFGHSTEDPKVRIVWHKDVLGWMEPKDVG